MKRLLVILFSIAISGLMSCEKPANIELPDANPKPVVYSFLSPDDSHILVTVTMTRPIYNTDNTGKIIEITNAKVTITDDLGNAADIPYVASHLLYRLSQNNYKIVAGRTYTIKVVFPGYEVVGSTTVPAQPANIKEQKGELVGSDQFGNSNIVITTKWDDFPSEKNYYRVTIDNSISYNPGDTFYNQWSDKFYNDANLDGKEIYTRNEIFYYETFADTLYFETYLLTSDYNYYEYNKRRTNYFGDDPFSEPLPMYNNVKGGLGVIGSYRRSSKTIAIPFNP